LRRIAVSLLPRLAHVPSMYARFASSVAPCTARNPNVAFGSFTSHQCVTPRDAVTQITLLSCSQDKKALLHTPTPCFYVGIVGLHSLSRFQGTV
jgi:hypothetical protein